MPLESPTDPPSPLRHLSRLTIETEYGDVWTLLNSDDDIIRLMSERGKRNRDMSSRPAYMKGASSYALALGIKIVEDQIAVLKLYCDHAPMKDIRSARVTYGMAWRGIEQYLDELRDHMLDGVWGKNCTRQTLVDNFRMRFREREDLRESLRDPLPLGYLFGDMHETSKDWDLA